jgi:large subunit ribosomal protein L13
MNSLNKTFLPYSNYKTRNWFVIDCKGQKLGRLVTFIIALLKGKTKPNYYSSIDIGAYVILTNVDLIVINKNSKHFIVSNPGRPGHSLKIRNAIKSTTKFTIEHAIKGMLSPTEMKRLMKRVNIYSGEKHPHLAQNPIKVYQNLNINYEN